MVLSILASVAALLLLIGLGVLIYRTTRTFDANPNHTYVIQSNGDIMGALREPVTLWNPSMSVLRDKDAPEISFPARRQKTDEIYMRSLVDRRTGRIALTVNTCTPRPFLSTTFDGHQLEITANVVFRLDAERIHIPSQLDNFGATLSDRIINLFDNEISKLRDEEVRAHQTEIEQKITRTLREIELNIDEELIAGMPLGIKVYEANFSFRDLVRDKERLADAAGTTAEGGVIGPIWMDPTRIDRLADTLASRPSEVRAAVMRMIELQTRQNIIETICKSGGLVAFTAKELGLNDIVGEDGPGGKQSLHVKDNSAASSATPTEEAEVNSEAGSHDQAVELDYYGRPKKAKAATPPATPVKG